MNEKKNSEYLDVLNVIAMFAVVMLHTNNCYWIYSTERYWFTSNIIECVMYFSVPIFFMITGATLIDYSDRYSIKEYLKKRIYKTIIPFLAWSLIGIPYCILIGNISLSDLSLLYVINGICKTNIVVIYWYFIPLFIVYMSIPLFSAVAKENKKNTFLYLVVMGFVINCLIPFIRLFFDFIPYNGAFTLNVVGGYILYILIGWLLHNCNIKGLFKVSIYILAVCGLLIHMIGTYMLSRQDGEINRTFKGYNAVPCILYSVGIFVFIKTISPYILKNKLIFKIINILKKYTFGIYLIHWFVINSITRLFDLNVVSIEYRLILPFVVVIVCVIIIKLLRMIPIIKYIIP